MAEAVKNNTRKRRPPTHFDQGYNQDNFQPRNANSYASREQNRQGTDLYNMNALAKLLTKFVNSANKKNLQARMKKKQQEIASSQKKPVMTEQKNVSKSEKAPKEQRSGTLAKGKQGAQSGQVQNRQEPSRTHEKGVKKIANSTTPSPIAQTKFNKTQTQSHQPLMKNFLPTGNPLNIQSMAKVNQEQILKLISKGTVDPSLFKNQFINSTDAESLRNLGRMSQSILRQTMRANEFRQDTKIFRRASYHIGIAYNIYIQNVKKKNPNYTPEDLDPTSVSRRMKQQNLQQARLQNLERQRIKAQQQMFKQKQLIQANAAKEKKGFQQFRQVGKTQISSSIKSTPQKQPICIDLQDDEEPQNKEAIQKTRKSQYKAALEHKNGEQIIKKVEQKQQKNQEIKPSTQINQFRQQYTDQIMMQQSQLKNRQNASMTQNKQDEPLQKQNIDIIQDIQQEHQKQAHQKQEYQKQEHQKQEHQKQEHKEQEHQKQSQMQEQNKKLQNQKQSYLQSKQNHSNQNQIPQKQEKH